MSRTFRIRDLHRTVRAAGWVSFFTDFSSEMIMPLLPIFLMSVLHSTTTFIGLIEGAAETTASLLKLASGYISDKLRKRKILVFAGYTLSSLSRPFIAVAGAAWHVLGLRMLDRVGKGIRTSPRDALVADSTPPEERGFAFGFQRAMDNMGAFAGPLVAAALLWLLSRVTAANEPSRLRIVFAMAAVPGLLVPFIIWRFIEESPPAAPAAARAPSARAMLGRFDANFWRYIGVVVLFTLGNSSDLFLVVRAHEKGVPQWQIPLLWAAFHAVKAAISTKGGRLSDLWGRKPVLLLGMMIYAASYVLFAFAQTAWHCWAIFMFYALYYACTEGTERAMVADLIPSDLRGTAYGIFHTAVGVSALPASLLFGYLWQRTGSPFPPFLTGAALAGAAAIGLLTVKGRKAV